jgi:hypothetical protein
MLKARRRTQADDRSWRSLWRHTGNYRKRDTDKFCALADRKKERATATRRSHSKIQG